MFGKTVSLQPMVPSVSNAAKIVNFVSMYNFHFVLARSPVHDSMTSVLLATLLTFLMSSVVVTKLDLSNVVTFSRE